MNKNILLFIFGVIFLIGMTTASLPSLGTFKQNENIRIAQICSDATFIIISSITFPNSSIAVSSTNMTSAGNGEFFYMFNITSSLGRYDLRGVSDGCEETFATYFEVTESGDTFSLSQALILLGQFGLIALFFGIGITFKQERWKLKTFFFICALLMGVIFLNSIRIVIGTSTNLVKMGSISLILCIIVLSFMFLYLLISYTIEMFHYFKNRSDMRWKISEQ